ncbi:hypothetical protein [Streptomyces sp. H27-D2]|uniref:hypothetical protein n=1 Tax=Streptomyces sp. H27-D2 TaxID=3046304 RepID=UPI002DBDF097|nr:hypothetical protein [Streptomyces sp. H27-D2]MEC4016126.1 hypothetical protein [Streptomyces sp. H27-D2]
MMTTEKQAATPADELAVQVLSNEGAMCGVCGDEPGDHNCPDCERCRRDYVAALRAAGWAPRTDTLAEAIEAARGEYLTDAPGTPEAYNEAVAGAVAAIGVLLLERSK